MTEILLVSTLVFLIIVSTMLTIVTLGNAVRLRRVKMSWKSGHLGGYPLFSSLFLIFTAVFFALSIVHYQQPDYAIFLSYNWIGLNWFISSYLMSKRYITEHGIVKNVNDPSQTISWNQICDYFESKDEKGTRFIFVYQTLVGNQKQFRRIELQVPTQFLEGFKQMISLKLGRRFDLSIHQFTDHKSIT